MGHIMGHNLWELDETCYDHIQQESLRLTINESKFKSES